MIRLPLVPALALGALLALAVPASGSLDPAPADPTSAATAVPRIPPDEAHAAGLSQEPSPSDPSGPIQELLADAPLGEQLDPAWERVRGRVVDGLVFLPLLAVAVVVLLVFGLLALWVGRWDRLYERVSPNVFVRNLVRQGVRAAVLLVGLLVAVDVLGITTLVGAVLGGAGVASIALGFAFKDIVENYLAGVLLGLRQPFAPNDDLVIEGQRGKVVRLTSRDTILMSLDGNHVRIPNAAVFRSTVVNFTRNPRRRFEVRLTVAPDTELSAALAEGLDVLRGMKGVLDDPPAAGRVVDVGDSWVTLAWFAWMDQTRSDFDKVRSEAIRLVLEGLAAADVDMPPPEHRVRLLREEGPPPVPTPSGPPDGRGAQLDVSVDTSLDEQIAEDRRVSEEEDLLTREPS